MGPDMVQLGHYELITMARREGLDIVQSRVLHVLGTSVSPLAPITGDVSCLGQDVPHGQVLPSDCLLRIVGIVPIGKGIALMKTGLLGRAGRGTNRTPIAPAEVNPGGRQPVQVGSQDVGLATCLPFGLTVRTNGTPSEVIDV